MAHPIVARRQAASVQSAVPVLIAGAVVYVVAVAWGASVWSYNVWAAVVVAPVLTIITVSLARGIASRGGDPSLTALVMMGWLVKLTGSAVRWWTAFELYGKADARSYDDAGRSVAQLFRQGTFDLAGASLRGGPTRVIEIATGVVYTVTGPSSLAGFFVFGWFAFLGTVLLWRAYALAVPEGEHRRYATLLFLLPSLVYWPSSLGKDAFMLFSLGVACYGAARVLARRRGGLVLFASGSAVGATVRPHVMLLVAGALVVGWLLGRAPRANRSGRVVRVIGAALLITACVALFGRLQEEFELDNSSEGVSSLLDFTSEQTSQGDSAFAAARVRTPLDLPWATATVLFRPFPTEADNAQAVVTALEGLGLALILALSWRRMVASVRVARAAPYLMLCVVYSLGFVVAFSTVGNFGILARQRVQVLPFVVALVCLAPRPAPHAERLRPRHSVRVGH